MEGIFDLKTDEIANKNCSNFEYSAKKATPVFTPSGFID